MSFDLPASAASRGYTLFSDERKNLPGENGESWTYTGLLIADTAELDNLLSGLMEDREEANHDAVMKFSKLNRSRSSICDLAVLWVRRLLSYGYKAGPLRFSLLGIDLNALTPQLFGADGWNSKGRPRAYSRFFRTNVQGTLRYLCPAPRVVDAIWHDSEGLLEQGGMADHICNHLRSEPGFDVRCDRLRYCTDDHRECVEPDEVRAAHILQFVDVVTGAFTHCLHRASSENKHTSGRYEVARRVAYLLEGMMFRPHNYNSRYHYTDHFKVSFFPDAQGDCYTPRPIRLHEQLPLEFQQCSPGITPARVRTTGRSSATTARNEHRLAPRAL